MIELPHQLDFVHERLFALLLAVSRLFREGLDGKPALILQPNGQIDRRKVSFSYFFNGLEELVEAPLVEFAGKHVTPCLDCLDVMVEEVADFLSNLEFKA